MSPATAPPRLGASGCATSASSPAMCSLPVPTTKLEPAIVLSFVVLSRILLEQNSFFFFFPVFILHAPRSEMSISPEFF